MIYLFGMQVKDRKLLQSIGQSMRDINEMVWIDYVLKNIKENDENVIIDDVRYENEILALKKNGFKIIYLDIHPDTQVARLKKLYSNYSEHIENTCHASEMADTHVQLSDVQINANENVNDVFDCIIEYINNSKMI